MALPDVPACPRCRGAMSPGYLAFLNRLNWVDRIGMMDASVFKGETIVGMLDTVGMTGHLAGWRCPNCRIMTLDYGAGVQ
ncbi:MAG TPA: PF20097 family protein [Thermoplasmata archaeon]|nr:PF20097 family protein [Thermoplasmata archaeon]